MQAQRLIKQEGPMETDTTELDATKAALKQCREQLQSAREEIDEKVEFVNVLSSYHDLFDVRRQTYHDLFDVRRQNVDKLDLFVDLFTRALKLLAALLECSLRSIEFCSLAFHWVFLHDVTLCLHR
ncbi:unnamed protein product [Aphanomyces euteiches]